MNHNISILHIVNWFPNPGNSFEALWIQRQIETLDVRCFNFILHLQIIPSGKFSIVKQSSRNFRQLIIEIPIRSWMLAEWLTTILLIYYLIKLKAVKRFNLFNFHIAYPLLTHWYLVKRFFKKPMLITEHWSAYHFNFGVKDQKKLIKVKKIFRNGIAVAAVSQSLLEDIRRFSGNSNFRGHVISNVVNSNIFKKPVTTNRTKSFFMLSLWKWPKQPLVLIRAFSNFLKESGSDYQLRIGGYGEVWNEIVDLIEALNIERDVVLLGKLSSEQAASEMMSCQAFLHCSDYETFSVVCAEALCCGAPVIASNVGGLTELVGDFDGLLVTANDTETWCTALNRFTLVSSSFNNDRISSRAQTRYNPERIGENYFKIIEQYL